MLDPFFRRIIDESPAVYAVTPAVRSPSRRTLIKLHDYILPISVIQFIVTTVGNIFNITYEDYNNLQNKLI